MDNNSLESLVAPVRELVEKTGAFIAEQYGKVSDDAIEFKSFNSLVSYVDKEAEKQLVDGLSKILPEAVFLTEEETVESQKGKLKWIIDPLDGTTNFLHQLPFFSISVALENEGEIVLGFVYEVNRKECFYAWKSGGAFLNGKPIHVRKVKTLEETLIATGFPYYDYDMIDAYLNVLQTFMTDTRGIRRLGSAALDLAYVACGRFDAFFEYSLNPWDVAGGAIIVQEAGGKVVDFNGGNDFLYGGEIVASSENAFEEVFNVIQEGFIE